ncbi:isochorismatase family protein [Saccharopolyspora sp. K220]|uniref:isochorismatase family protein n=1 Tax=Saccharopolyspora soli TaxID=2926618 RepID=UPI001F56320A|nr:isochorismatase family protein [Saccharopolyspora soli]MCI2421390.1 isochorismatase family protein [Saccharopolyspora soli]
MRGKDMNPQSRGIWDAAECALLLIDYQDNVLAAVFEQDRRVIELNVSTIARMAQRFDIPVVLSTVGVEMGASDPVLPSLSAALPGVEVIDRSHMNAWEDPVFVDAVKATGRKKLVIGGIVTSVCVTFPAISARADGYEVAVLADAIGDGTKEEHDIAVMRLVQAGAVPMTTLAMMAEWFRDWKSPIADHAREVWVPYREKWAALKRGPEQYEPTGLIAAGGLRPGTRVRADAG